MVVGRVVGDLRLELDSDQSISRYRSDTIFFRKLFDGEISFYIQFVLNYEEIIKISLVQFMIYDRTYMC